ncbi:DUF6923 family protein [Allocoleopsis franciscana]|uniref:Conserved repeat protein n=1 Tax=Allocoleopsis franciscana PCC 7113 TaxID=1173027 RepID=K9WAF2_9CYAN|nr:hypothetical protein [Allocoleopsis franciscana]AFZ17360.1 conserved repeat protein [Allocoleopsis franciscana PCC 7113]
MQRNSSRFGVQTWKKKVRILISLLKFSANKILPRRSQGAISGYPKGSLMFRKFGYALISLLTLVAVVVGYYSPALTQSVPAPDSFICDRTLYISQGLLNQNSTLSSVITTPNFALNTVGTATVQYNAIGLNVRDGFIYGIAPQSDPGSNLPPTIYRINNTGAATAIGAPQPNGAIVFDPIPNGNPNQSFAFAGDINRNGIYFVYVTNIPAPGNNLFAIDLATNPNTPTMVSSLRVQRADGTSPDLSDISFNPVDDQLYAFDSFRVNGQPSSQGQMARIDTTTGAVTYFGATQPNVGIVGASFFDAFGNFYTYETTGNISVARNLSSSNPVVFSPLGNAGVVQRFDGASCAFAPVAEKIVEPQSVAANGIITYRYRLANQLGQPLSTANLSFTDQLPAGLTYVDQTLNNTSVGGTPNAYGGTPLLQIAGITIPPRGFVEISVNVRVSLTASPGTVLNQATINNVPSVPGVTLPPTIPSDFPPTGIYPDPTPLVITPAPPTPRIGLAKRVASSVNLGNGVFRVTYALVVSNLGNVDLNNVQVTEDLTTTFANATSFTVAPNSVSSPSGDLTPNPNYNGRADNPNLLTGTTNTLTVGQSKTIQFIVDVTPGANLGPYNNQAVASGTDPNGQTVTDLSQNGTNSDPDNDGNPANNNDPTPVNFNQTPALGVAKEVVSIVPADAGNSTVTYRIRARNYGQENLTNLQLTENLTTTFDNIPFTVPANSVTSPNGNLTPNSNYNGRTDINLLVGTDTLAVGETKVIEFIVIITPGNQTRTYENLVQGTAQSPSGSVSDQSQAGINPDPDNDGNPTNNNDPTPLDVGPNLRLVKRITNVIRSGAPISGIDFQSFVDNLNDRNDNVSGWSQLPGGVLTGVFRIGSDALLQTGDEVEYTVYFLSDGTQLVTDAKVCDPIPEKTTFIPDSFQAGQGILLNQQTTNTSLTNALDTDQGTFFSRLTPVTSPCPNTNNSNGSILVNLGDLPATPPNNVGFIRFRVRID